MEFDPANSNSDRPQTLASLALSLFQGQMFEEQLTVIVENMAEAFFALDLTGCCIYANRKAEQLLGVERATLMRKTIWEIFQAAPTSELYQQCHRALIEPLPIEFAAFHPTIDRWLTVRLLPTSSGLAAYFQDITAQKKAEAALRETQLEAALRERETQLSSIFQTIPDGIIILNRSGQIVAANPAAEQILRLTCTDITERSYNDLSWSITTADGEPFPEAELPFVQVMRTGKPIYQVEHAIAHPDGTKIILSINASPLFNAEGEITDVIAAISDITERKRTETILQNSEARYRSVIETAAEGILLQQQDGTIFTCNASAERILGLTAAQIMGRTSLDPCWYAIYEDGSPYPEEQHPAMMTLRTGEPQSNVTMGIRKPDGTLTWISINTRPIFQANDTTPFAVVVSFFDITDRKQAEEALRKTEQRYRSVIDNVKEVIFQTDAAGCWTLLNLAWTEITGFSVEESLGNCFLDYVHPDDRPRNQELFRAFIEQGKAYCRHEIRYLTKAGEFRWIEVFARPILEDDGTFLGISGTLNDTTERKQADEKRVQLIQEQTARSLAEKAQHQSAFLAEVSEILASSLEYEQTLQTVARLAVPYFADWCAVDLLNDDGSISRVAVAHADPEKVQFGWAVAQRFPRHLNDGYGISTVMKTGQSEIAIEITDEQLTAAVLNTDYLEILRGLGLKSCILSPLQARGRVLGSLSFVFSESNRHYSQEDLGLAEDLARRAAIAIDNARLYHTAQKSKQAAETSADRTARLQTVTAALSESLTPEQVIEVIVEQTMDVLKATATLVVLVSQDRTELEIVKSIGYTEDLVETWRRFSIDVDVPLAEAIRTGKPVWLESLLDRIARYPHLVPVYKRYDFQSWISLPFVVEGRSVGGMLISFREFRNLDQDEREFVLALTRQCAQAISRAQLYEAERCARAEAEQANRVKDEFLAVLSHELRSPLNPILGWTKMLRTGKLQPERASQALATIERNAILQAQLIEDLLDISRMLRGKLSLNIASVDLTSVIQGAIETVHLAASAKSIQIETLLQPQQRTLLGDANRLQQVIWNLLSNAIKFTPNHGQVSIQLQEIDRQVQIQVIDNGQGIKPDFLPYVFEYFRQADSSTTRNFGGLGLGLAIARQIVELHGGTIGAESPGEGLGATFTVRLPLANTALESATVLESSMPATDLTGLKILVVDDEADMRDLAEFILSQHGAEVTLASSAGEAFTLLFQSVPDILLCDIGMPNTDGYMLLRQLRALPPEQGGEIPAIALTAYAGDFNQQQALQAGFQQHLTKPIEPDKLVRAVATLTRNLTKDSTGNEQ